jgi:glycosyltransferase involved in cell wall biosynthesis
LLVLGRYLPEKSGGIENYSQFLAKLLSANEHEVEVAILNSGKTQPYEFDGIKVIPLITGFESFCVLLKSNCYEVVHFQELSAFGGIELFWFREARKYCKKLFFTFHLPYLTCYKNDFRYKGIEDCNQFNSIERCVECIIATKLNYHKTKSLNLRNATIRLSLPFLKNSAKTKKLRKALEELGNNLTELIELCDTIFIYGKWFKKLLIENGYESPKLQLIPHISKPEIERRERDYSIKNRLLFAGRIEKAKGLHLLAKAMNIVNRKELTLDVVGNIVNQEYFNCCKELYCFNYKGVVPREQLLQSFLHYDFLILPSVFTEMSSLVLKEAFYEGLPVIVSSAKGNKDVVIEEKNGFIFEYDNASGLAEKINKSYQLLSSRWQPQFSIEITPEENDKIFLSYYK